MAFTVISSSSTGFALAANGDTVVVPYFGLVYSNNGGSGVNGSTVYGTVYNYGSISGGSAGITIGSSASLSFINNGASGQITGGFNGLALLGSAIIDNAGEISGVTGINVLSIADITFSNSGTVRASGGAYSGGAGIDKIFNSGRMVGYVDLSGGNDFYDGRGGTVVGMVIGGNGNDILIGGSGGDKLYDESGSNWIVGGGGDDEVTIGNFGFGTTTAWAGEANFGTDNSTNDTLNVAIAGPSANIFLGGKVSDPATGALVAWIWGFENANGTYANDSIIGTAGNNIINGIQGADWLVGNGGYDQFVFNSRLSDGSTISGFSADLIDLHNIDANLTVADDQAFVFRTVHTNNAAGEMVFTNFGGGGQIQLYTHADNIVDATIFISYAAGGSAPTASDFWL